MRLTRVAFILLYLLLGLVLQLWAADRYASPNGQNTIGAPCSSGTPCTIAVALAQMGAGDILYLYGGTYATQIDSNITHIPTGTNWGNAPQIKAVSGQIPVIRPVSSGQVQAIILVSYQGVSNYLIQYIIFDGIVLDGSQIGGTAGASSTGGMQLNGARHIRFTNGQIRNFYYGSGIEFSRSQGPSDFHEILNTEIYNNGILDTGGSGNVDHGAYASAADTLYDRVHVHHNGHIGMQLYNAAGGTDRIIVRNSIFHENGQASTISAGNSIEIFVRGNQNQLYNNIFYNCRGDGMALSGASNATVYNNTFYNCTQGLSLANSSFVEIRNNIVYQSNAAGGLYQDWGGNSSITTTPNILTNPGYANAAGADFHLGSGSVAIGSGVNLSSDFTTDAEGTPRPSGSTPWDAGPFVFAASEPPQPDPVDLRAWYMCDGNANDSSGNGHTGTLLNGALTNGAPLLSGTSCVFDGSNDAIEVLNVTGMQDPDSFSGCWWVKPTAVDTFVGTIFQMGDSYGMAVQPGGALSAFIYNGSSYPSVLSSGVNLLDGTAHFACVTYDRTAAGPGLRLYVDDAQVGFTSLSDSISYGPSDHLWIGRHVSGDSGYYYTGLMDQGRLYTGQLTPTAVHNLFVEQVPAVGMSVTHTGWYAANAAEGTVLGTPDVALTQIITSPMGIRWAIHKADTGTLTEYFRPFCRVLSSIDALVLDWTEVTNSFASLGVRFYADSVVTTGTPTSVLLPTNGFTGAPGLYLDNPVDTTNPYDAIQRLTISQGEHREVEMKVEFGSPRVAGEKIECRPYRENGTDFGTSSYANIVAVVLTGPSATRSIAGPVWSGVTAN